MAGYLCEADADSPTLRERLETHLSDPYCASCHRLTDPIGLGFENFDGIGKWRPTENDAVIDPSGEEYCCRLRNIIQCFHCSGRHQNYPYLNVMWDYFNA
jgi:hypothetical protein